MVARSTRVLLLAAAFACVTCADDGGEEWEGNSIPALTHTLRHSDDPYDVMDAVNKLGGSKLPNGLALALEGIDRVLGSQAMRTALRREGILQVQFNRAFTLQQMGNLHEALLEYERVLESTPRFDDARIKAAYCAKELGDHARTLSHLRIILGGKGRSNPANHMYLGDTLNNLKRFDEAEAAYSEGLRLLEKSVKPRSLQEEPRAHAMAVQLLTALGDTRLNAKQPARALEAYLRARAFRPNDPALLSSLAMCRLELSSWDNLADDQRRLLNAVEAELSQHKPSSLSPYQGLFIEIAPQLRANISQSWLHQLQLQGMAAVGRAGSHQVTAGGAPSPSQPLRLCYVSRRFHAYPGTQLLLGVFKRHDPTRVRTTCFASGPDDGSSERRRVATECHAFHDISNLTISDMHDTIVRAECDVLVDYDGLHDFNNVPLMTTRPAPVQATWLGFAATTGSGRDAARQPTNNEPPRPFDFMIADRVVAPSELSHKQFTESLWYLDGSYQPQDPDQALATARPVMHEEEQNASPGTLFAPAKGQLLGDLSSGARWQPAEWVDRTTWDDAQPPTDEQQPFVFVCFNRWSKIDPETFAAWMAILRQVPHASLVLLGGYSHNATVSASEFAHIGALQAEAAAHGVLPSRLIFAPKLPRPQHLSRHFGADMMLDTFIYGAHTTTADGLFTGLPGITRVGDAFASRVGASLLRAAEAASGIVHTTPSYENAAVEFAAHPDVLLQQRMNQHAGILRACASAKATCGWTSDKTPDSQETPRQSAPRADTPDVFRADLVARRIETSARASTELHALCSAEGAGQLSSGWRDSLCNLRFHVVG